MADHADTERHRPPVDERWTGGRTEPGSFEVRTRWLYSDPDPRVLLPPGRTRHAFYRGGDVTRSDWRSAFGDIASHLWRAIESFGDDADLVITVQRKDTLEGEDRSDA